MTITVVIADDQALVRTGLRMILDNTPDIEVVGEAGTGSDAVSLVARTRPDVVLMDIRMPELDGVQATAAILADRDATSPRILVLTTFDLDEYVYAALRAGASGFLLKDALAADLIAAVRVVAAGEATLAPTVTRRLLDRFVGAQPVIVDPPEHAMLGLLTGREREVLQQPPGAPAGGVTSQGVRPRFRPAWGNRGRAGQNRTAPRADQCAAN